MLSTITTVSYDCGSDMAPISVAEDERSAVFSHKPNCSKLNCPLASCTCDDELLLLDDSEQSPLIPLLNYSEGEGTDVRCLTDSHCLCHEAEPRYSNARARRKLAVASIVCLFFVIAQGIGKSDIQC